MIWLLLGVGALVAVGVVASGHTQQALAYIKGVASQIEVAAIGAGFTMRADAAAAFLRMKAAAALDGIVLKVDSAFRSMEEQQSLADQKAAGTIHQAVATPGFSNHQGGIAVDIDVQTATYGAFTGPIWDWLNANAATYGFDNAEGRSVNEPWHWVYTAAPVAVADASPTPDMSPTTDPSSALASDPGTDDGGEAA